MPKQHEAVAWYAWQLWRTPATATRWTSPLRGIGPGAQPARPPPEGAPSVQRLAP